MIEPVSYRFDFSITCPRCKAPIKPEEHTLERDGAPVVVCPRCGWEFEPPAPLPTVLVQALHYAGMGYPVLPLEPGGKAPHPVLGARGLTAASTNPHIIDAWFLDRPDSNIGIAVPDGVAVLDFDNRDELRAFLARYPELKTAPRSLTPRGAHIWLAVPEGVELRSGPATRVLPQFEVKKPGKGYVVEHPSKTPAGKYVWDIPLKPPHELISMPDGLLNALTYREWLWTKARAASRPASNAVFERILSQFAVEAQPKNRHNALIRAAIQLVKGGAPPEYLLALKKLAKKSGLPTKEIRQVFRWVFKNFRIDEGAV